MSYSILVDWVANRTFNLVDEKLFADLDINTSKSYNDCAELLRFIDQYAVHNVGTRELDKFLKARPGETLLDILSDQDIAYSILVYENSVDVWEEIMENRGRENPRAANQLYHVKRGTKLREFADGWTPGGREYYRNVVKMVKGWKANEQFWESLQEFWREYVELNHSRVSVRNGPSMEMNENVDDQEEVELMDFTQV